MALHSQTFRLLKLLVVILRYRLYRLVDISYAYYPLHILSYLFPSNWQSQKTRTRGEDLRRALEVLGPIFVKFGQILSTRHDVIGEDIIDELEKLQDCAPPFPGEIALSMVENIYGKDCMEKIFTTFTQAPLASASIAQVHAAILHDGSDVVVKILRPGVHKAIKQGVALLYNLAGIIGFFWKDIYCLRPKELIEEFEQSLANELDLIHEAANASQLQRNFSNSLLLYIPKIHWQYAHHSAIIMERIDGIPIADIETLKKSGVDLKKLAERGIELFFTQVFRDSFFHADMHPGNIFVSKEHPKNPSYILVDFGIMGSLSPRDQHYLAANILAFLNRDYRRITLLHLESAWLPANTRIDQFEATIRAACEPMFAKPLKDISFGQLLLRLFQTAKRFNIEIQPQLLLMQKTLLNIESLSRMIYPDIDIWGTAKPFLEQWMKEQLGYKRFFKKIPDLPNLLYEALFSKNKPIS